MKHFEFENDKLIVLDQRKLPFEKEYFVCSTYQDVYVAIKDMIIRGAPLIGIVAAYGVVLGFKEIIEKDMESTKIYEVINILASSRPTAVNLFWALERMKKIFEEAKNLSQSQIYSLLLQEARKIEDEDKSINKKIGEHGNTLIKEGANILTHCNAGALATGGYGTALGVIREAHFTGKNIHVYVDETRPYLQGARLTAFELSEDGIPNTVICDNMAGYLMKLGKIDCVIVGADRIALNGDTANKIGTYSLSVLAKHHGIPFYIAAPVSTIDFNIKSGSEIPIEERSEDEIRFFNDKKIVPDGSKVFNPAFDVTPAENITAIITEKGVIFPPFEENISKLKEK
ncbi:translation initiation factor, aIF-2BI family [Caldicellulosiruptor kronotskyensis 2002]|uniref:Methylthioribose-1-phosphate isomerase n=1 Tax=Caldicellulosiruptor kronotskyensis (strain DSM 18902 / VKM B-2412 / 2002) TaxID=632348 RepID=E4SBS8_CALK2|nr:S-methyl-5-thioribose-1-phosphate isomerase [Caldicellulosiruptor kronotskyensis]ADQ46201.1 translation initiation factor, aIF-2BI family [Caldicellulosiruptor kronotskyensis 2002]